MATTKADIINQLRKEIFPLQGLKYIPAPSSISTGLGPIEKAFPNGCFPTGAIHEFLSGEPSGAAATGGFVAGLLAPLMQCNGASVWISSSRKIFPTALKFFGLAPDRIIFVDVENEKDALWAMEEALKCNGLAAVVGEMQEMSFTASRRLQLVVEQSGVTGFILRHQPRNINTTACVSRWKISSLASVMEDDLPGVGFPRWKVELVKIRNGKTGMWQVEYYGGRFHISTPAASILLELKRKTG
ncbi:MAG: Error-prone repair protein ImuA [Ferruginibacter sp.]